MFTPLRISFMWRSHWTLRLAKTLSILVAVLAFSAPSMAVRKTRLSKPQATPSASPTPSLSGPAAGPASDEEARILWVDGKKAMDEGRYDQAIVPLERLVARYPGYPGFIESRLLLGKALLQQGRPKDAQPYLKDYIQDQGTSAEAIRARLLLIRTRLALGEYNEALLGAIEVSRWVNNKPELLAETLLLKARAQIGLKQDMRAESTLDSAKKTLTDQMPASLRTEAFAAGLKLKLLACAKFPSAGPLDESQIRDQLDRRGTCLLQSLLIHRQALAAGDMALARLAQSELTQAARNYSHTCSNPPPPPPITIGPDKTRKTRTAQQVKTYNREMSVVLEQDCRAKLKQGYDLTQGWKESLPTSTAPLLTELSTELLALSNGEISGGAP